MTFRKQAQQLIKQYRTDSNPLIASIATDTKLNAKNEALHQALQAIEMELSIQEIKVTKELRNQPAEPSTITKAAHFTAHTVHSFKATDWSLVGAKALLTLMTFILWLITTAESIHKAHTQASNSPKAKQSRAFLKACLRAFWDTLKVRKTIRGTYESQALEFILCLS